MSTGLIDIMKRSAMEAMDNAKMCDLRYGKVVSTSPLKVQITNLLTIPESMLVVPQNLTDYDVYVSLDWVTETVPNHTHQYGGSTEPRSGGGGDESFASHSHSYSGTTQGAGMHDHSLISRKNKVMTIHNALKVGDKVALLRKQGGQSYFILDRIRGD